MLLNKRSQTPLKAKLAMVKRYVENGVPLRKLAQSIGVSHATLWHWVKRYEKFGVQGLERGSGRVSNQATRKHIETHIVLLKERWPGLSIRKAQAIITQAGHAVSTFLVWRVWRDYGYVRKKSEDLLDPFVQSTPIMRQALDEAMRCAQRKDYRKASAILDGFPRISRTRILCLLPEEYLSPRRRLDRLCLERGEGSYEDYAQRARLTGKILEKHSFFYSSIIANFLELDALDIIGRPEQKAKVLDAMAIKMRGIKNSSLRFLFAFEQAYTAVYLLQMSKAMRFLDTCRRLVYLLPNRHYQEMFGALLVLVGKFKSAGRFYRKALRKSSLSDRTANLYLQTARYAHCYAGDYTNCQRMLAAVNRARDRKTSSIETAYDLTNAYLHYGQGHLVEATDSFVRSLEAAHQGKHVNRIYAASVGLAGVAMALNNKAEAKTYLKKYLPLMRKNHLLREELLLRCFLNRKTEIAEELDRMPPFCLLNLLKQADQSRSISDYRACFLYAFRHGLIGLFHRWIVFFPAPIVQLLDRGKKTGLPRAILNFPIFNQNILVYNVKLLGRVVLTRNQRRLRIRLSPLEKAFSIHLAMRADAPGKAILLRDLCRNFWPKSQVSTRHVSHLLLRLKKKLRLPGHLLVISARKNGGESRLINNGIYLTTDYREFKSLLTQARTLLLSGEWQFARREYLRAFALLRGEPFRRMYDGWSDTIRGIIFDMIEENSVDFIKECNVHGDGTDAVRIMTRIASIIPGSTALPRRVSAIAAEGKGSKGRFQL